MVAPRRRAFFYPGPVVFQPGLDQFVIAFTGSGNGALRTPVQPMQLSANVRHTVSTPKLAPDDQLNAKQCPAFGGKASRLGSTFENRQQPTPIGSTHLRGTPRHDPPKGFFCLIALFGNPRFSGEISRFSSRYFGWKGAIFGRKLGQIACLPDTTHTGTKYLESDWAMQVAMAVSWGVLQLGALSRRAIPSRRLWRR